MQAKRSATGRAIDFDDVAGTVAFLWPNIREGLEIVTPVFASYVIPITLGILVALFFFQYRGTAGVGAV